MDETRTQALPAGVAPRADHALPPANGAGPLHKGRRTIADVLERAGRDDEASYVRSLDVDTVDQMLQERVRLVESGVRARPLISVLGAVVVGFLIGRMLRD
jgi:hypothetical protein